MRWTRLRSTLFFAVLCLLKQMSAVGTFAGTTDQDPFRILVVSSSFGKSAKTQLVPMAEHEGIKLRMFNAFIGACTFQRHWESILKAQADPEFVSHSTLSDKVHKPNGWTASLPDLVASEPWDVIVTQQSARGSGSWTMDAWQPYADNLIDYFRKHAPTAEIMLQQTWSFPEPAAIKEGGQVEQFVRIERNYRTLAAHQQLRVIPTGNAVQLAREGVTYRFATQEAMDACEYPDRPPPTGDVAGGYNWRNNSKTDHKWELRFDPLHMNRRGEYLQACVWFGVIFQRDPASITYVPEGLDSEDAEFLRDCASRAIALYPQVACRHGDELQGFALAGADRVYHWARAEIDGDTVVVSCDRVPEPVAVNYGWSRQHPWANLFNQDGLPALTFRTDTW